ncbi:AEC family transporter [Vallitalea okinawensis]|uniref:AEC family transporter n=1 Tax=Vallitalea okinawensis TaxID=2078660 RepID=UPI000CFCB219|nr:AEC family transporter [Vallitalea okinawensis]
MEQVNIIIEQIGMLVLLTLIGMYAKKKKILPENASQTISKIIVNITLPILTVLSLTKYKFPSSIWTDGLAIIGFAIAIHLLAYSTGVLALTRLQLTAKKRNVFLAQLIIGNTVFLAFPLMQSLFGDTGLVYALIYYLVSSTFIWTLGVYLFNKHHISNKREIFKSLLNPCTIAFAIGILAIVLDIDSLMSSNPEVKGIYDYIYLTFSPVGDMTVALSMIFIGLTMANIDFKQLTKILKDKSIWILVGIKLLIIPFIMMGFLVLLPLEISLIAITVILLESAMPSSTITVAIASEYGADYQYALEIAVVTTVAAIISIPVIILIFNQVILA